MPSWFPSWLVDVHYLPDNAVKQRAALVGLRDAFSLPSVFYGDNMFAFGRSLNFLRDKHFTKAFMDAKPDKVERSLVWRKHTLYWAAQMAMKLEGDFVEAACYKGFTARVLCNALDLRSAGKLFWLYDLFDRPHSEEHRLESHGPGLYDSVLAAFLGDPVRVIRGRVPESFAQGAPEKISLLHLDMNNAASEIGALEMLYDRIVPGGIVVLDDYGVAAYHEQTEAHDQFFGARGLPILELPTSQALVVKR